MKAKNAFAFVVMLVLIVSALFVGAYKGWTEERAETESAAQPLDEALKTCVETANNILTVARRHVSTDDEAVKALIADKAALESSKIGLQEKAEAAESLAVNAKALLAKLSDTETVKADDRDKMYERSCFRRCCRPVSCLCRRPQRSITKRPARLMSV